LTHTVQRLAYLKMFRPEQRDVRPHDVLVPESETPATFAAWSATSFSSFVPYRNPPTR
jgi:hypothetical protein